MSGDGEPSLDFVFADIEVEYVAPESSEPLRGRVVDNSLRPSTANVAAFWAKVVQSPTCWYWVGAISAPDGYGRFNFQRENRQRTMLAHRFSVELVHGPLDPNVVCEHKCNEPLCVRVGAEHLVQSTHSENVRYAIAQGRLSGHVLLDGQGRSRYSRSLAIREALRGGYDEDALLHAKTNPGDWQGTLF
ncbi:MULTISPECIES: HNH endonuclease [Rhodococcus]|uniref:HNH endonuclease n=1 Tax=Rhodococcus chondri TaxID=3065941 RepID=A0ABU7JVD8_9NOCA|nr:MULTISPECIES: HNH endonuclease [Rhodococcus]MEE2033993.1 HNH endonuclease [Rhodococcus sp. CC-R104]QQM55674.1 HNH endonuclease [Rhodococcus pyridinivorans]